MAKFQFKACSPPNCSCPDVEFDNGVVTITDDYKGSVKLTLEELIFIAQKTQNMLNNVTEDIIRQNNDFVEQQKEVKQREKEILEKQKKK